MRYWLSIGGTLLCKDTDESLEDLAKDLAAGFESEHGFTVEFDHHCSELIQFTGTAPDGSQVVAIVTSNEPESL